MKLTSKMGKTRTPPRTGWGSLFFVKIKAYQVELLILAGFLSIFALLNANLPAVRVGDGSDYYATFLAWRTNLKPFMTPQSWQAYEALQQSGEVAFLMEMPVLRHINLPVQLGQQSDFPHFWFYSLLAFLITLPFQVLGLTLSVHASFLMLHALLLSFTWIIAYRCFAWRGLASVAVLTCLSPMVWYMDKVHTEMLTFCVTTSAVIIFLRKRYLIAAFFLSLAATQNVSFAAISGVAWVLGLWEHRSAQYSLGEIAIIILTVALNVLSPLYTFFRFGVLSPQQLFGYIHLNSHLSNSYIWFFDPDIGLFPHWPLGLVILLAFLIVAFPGFRPGKSSIPLLLFVGVYVVASLAAQASTVNINAGGNPGVSRYALWYLALFFPAMLVLINKAQTVRWLAWTSLAILIVTAIYNFGNYHPGIDQFNYVRPSAFSYWLQKNHAKIYNPPVEIFSERYGGKGENILNGGYLAVLGPDCRKLLIMDRQSDQVIGGDNCKVDRRMLSEVIQSKTVSLQPESLPVYAWLDQAEFEASRTSLPFSNWYALSNGEQAINWLQSGWGAPEAWGVWMIAEKAALKLPCPLAIAPQQARLILQLELNSLVSLDHPKNDLKIAVNQRQIWSGKIAASEVVGIPISQADCNQNGSLRIELEAENLSSPQALGLAEDDRLLGVGLVRLRYISISRNPK